MNNSMLTNKEIENLKRDDGAFFNSVLSYAIYTDREWIAELDDSRKVVDKNFINEEKDLTKDQILRNNYENYLYIYIKNNFKTIDLGLNNGEFKSEGYGYKTDFMVDQSSYMCLNNLARAGFFTSDNPDGTKSLHLTFRGTDNKARAFKDFVGDAYLDMSAYYDAFKPLEKAILDYAKDPKNNIRDLQVSGHSLGGAMVQEFFKSEDVKGSGLTLNGFTYGAPGTNKNFLYGLATEGFHAIKQKSFNAFKEMGKNILPPLIRVFSPSGFEMSVINKVFNLVNLDVSNVNEIIPKSRLDSQETNKIQQYEHSGDLIPKSGALVYGKVGNVIGLKDDASKDSRDHWMLTGQDFTPLNSNNKFKNFINLVYDKIIQKPIAYIKNVFSFQYHDMMRYVVNLENKIVKDVNGNEKISEHKPKMNEFLKFKDICMDRFEEYNVAENEKLRMKERQVEISSTKVSDVEERMLSFRNSLTKGVTSGVRLT